MKKDKTSLRFTAGTAFFGIVLMIALFVTVSRLSYSWTPRTEEPLALRVMTWNIHNGKNGSGRETLSQIRNVIRTVDPDVLILNEANYTWTFSKEDNGYVFLRGKDMAKEIAKDCEFAYYYEPRKKTKTGYWYYGVAILSKYPLSEQEYTELPRIEDNGMIRVLASATLDLEGKMVKIFGTHMAPRSEGRMKQVEVLTRNVKHSRLPVILAGDMYFHAPFKQYREIHNLLEDSWRKVNGLEGGITCASARVDYIFSGHEFEVKASHVFFSEASDHFPVITAFQIPR